VATRAMGFLQESGEPTAPAGSVSSPWGCPGVDRATPVGTKVGQQHRHSLLARGPGRDGTVGIQIDGALGRIDLCAAHVWDARWEVQVTTANADCCRTAGRRAWHCARCGIEYAQRPWLA